MSSHHDDNTPESMPIGYERVLEILEKGDIETEHGMLRWSSNYAFLVSLHHQETRITTVYKPRSGERPLWDFPDGTLCKRETASFLTSEALNWRIVPPTVLREGPRGLGSFQFFIDHDPQVNYFSFDERMIPQLMRMALFDCVINNADRKGGHCLLDAEGHLWGIDHGITFHTENKLRTVIWDFAGQPIPESLQLDLEVLCAKTNETQSAFRQALNRLLYSEEIDAFLRRIDRLLKSRRYPKPGRGPNYPWPPV